MAALAKKTKPLKPSKCAATGRLTALSDLAFSERMIACNLCLFYGFDIVCSVWRLAIGYWLYQFSTDGYDTFGWRFRHLTFWGLTGAVCAAWLMLSLSRKGRPPSHNALSSSVAVLNAMVLLLYWKLYFVDPSLVNGNGPIVWHQEYYLHLVGPLLMIGDAVFINRAFKDHLAGISLTIGICLTYIL